MRLSINIQVPETQMLNLIKPLKNRFTMSISSTSLPQPTGPGLEPDLVVIHEESTLVPASSDHPYAVTVALNAVSSVQLATDARRDREHAKTMVCVQSTLERMKESFQPLVETNHALQRQLAQSESLPRQITMVHQEEVEALKEQIALQKQQLEATQQQFIETIRQSEERAAAAARAQVAAEERATEAALKYAETIKAITKTSHAQIKEIFNTYQSSISNLQSQLDQAKKSQAKMQKHVDRAISALQTELEQTKQTTSKQKERHKKVVERVSKNESRIAQNESGLQNLAAHVQSQFAKIF
jgi:chromosome segregation ATPase